MNDDEGEGQEHPQREHEHGSHQVDHVVPANKGLSSKCSLILQSFDQTHSPDAEDNEGVEKRMLPLEVVEGGLLHAGVVRGAEEGGLKFDHNANMLVSLFQVIVT